jgi:hypothetical protein
MRYDLRFSLRVTLVVVYSWAAVGAQYQSGASDANFEAAVKESAFFQVL